MRADARGIYDGLLDEGLPLVILSLACGAGALILLSRGAARGVRPLAAGAVVAAILAWAAAQYPDLLPGALTIEQGAGAASSLTALLVVSGVALLVVGPALALLFALDQRSMLEEEVEP